MRSFLFKKNFRGYTMFLRVISSFLFFFAENIREVNLIIEQGNTSSKVAVYKNGHIEASFVYKQFGVSVVAALFEKYAFTQGILSTVIDTDDELIAYLKNKLQRFVFLDEHVALPIKVEYGTPKTLGKDRLAAVVGANYLRPGKNLLVIDPSTGLYKDTQVETNIVGNREPKLIGGFNNSFSYKNFNLSFLFDIRLGGDIYNGTEYYLVTKGLSTKTINRESVSFTGVVNTGTAAKPSYETKTITYNANETYQVGNSTRSGKYMIQEYYKNYAKNAYNFITDTNWLRLRSISLSYDFKDLLKKQNIIKGLTATITGTNLFVWTNYKGMDPETCVSGSGTGGSGSAGIDYCGVPATAGMSFGINLTF